MVTMALRSSFGPESRTSVSIRSVSSRRESRSRFRSAETSSPSRPRSKYAETSPTRRSKSVSVASRSSSRFRSRITVCDCCGSDHRLGSATFFSTSASCARSLGASKIAPQVGDLLPHGSVLAFELFYGESSHESTSLTKCLEQHSAPHPEPHHQSHRGDHNTEISEPVPMLGIERWFRDEGIPPFHPAAHIPGRFVYQSAERVYRGRDAVIGGAQHPAVILYGAHPRHVQVLTRRAALAIPSVVRDVPPRLGPALREQAYLVGEDRLVADEHPDFVAIQLKDRPFAARGEIPH